MMNMNSDVMQGKWKQLKGKVQQRWGMLTNDDLDRIKGSRDELAGLLQEKYGYARIEAEKEVEAFLRDEKVYSNESTTDQNANKGA